MVLWAATLDLVMAWPGDENRWKVIKNPKSHQNFDHAQLVSTITLWSDRVRQYTWAFLILELTSIRYAKN